MKRSRIILGVTLMSLAVPVTTHAAAISFSTSSILKAGFRAVISTITALAPRGSIIAQGQYVCDSNVNPNCGLVSGTHAIYIPEPSTYTATGGNVKVSGTAKYEAVRMNNAFSGAVATTRGLRTGTSATLLVVLDIVRNHTGVSYDCVLKDRRSTGTGSAKITLFDNKTATGMYLYSTPFVKGAIDIGSCGTLDTPKANSDVKLYFYSLESFVGK